VNKKACEMPSVSVLLVFIHHLTSQAIRTFPMKSSVCVCAYVFVISFCIYLPQNRHVLCRTTGKS